MQNGKPKKTETVLYFLKKTETGKFRNRASSNNQFLNHIQPASVGSIECAELLLQNSATIDPVDRSKTTPLHLAAENGHAKMIELLLDYGADITMEDINSRNALERAILSGRK